MNLFHLLSAGVVLSFQMEASGLQALKPDVDPHLKSEVNVSSTNQIHVEGTKLLHCGLGFLV